MTFQQLIDFLKSLPADPYLKMVWYCLSGYAGCWLLALALAQATRRRGGSTIVYKARQAWGIAFILHLLAVMVITILWWKEFVPFVNWPKYLAAYVVLAIFDVVFLILMFRGLSGYRSYAR